MALTHTPAPVYFGGSRALKQSPGLLALVQAVVNAVTATGSQVHTGCQLGADQAVVTTCPRSFLVVFAVESIMSIANHLQVARVEGARVISCAGGTSAPMHARYLLRSIAAFQGCQQAVFFMPGAGSLAVAREAVRQGLQVFAFQQEPPAPVPSCAGCWSRSYFYGFYCWQWQTAQQSLF
jgi:hypothetical protein